MHNGRQGGSLNGTERLFNQHNLFKYDVNPEGSIIAVAKIHDSRETEDSSLDKDLKSWYDTNNIVPINNSCNNLTI